MEAEDKRVSGNPVFLQLVSNGSDMPYPWGEGTSLKVLHRRENVCLPDE